VQETEDKQLLIRYLLGDLNEGELEQVEERYFTNNDFYTQLLVTEDELIDSYMLEELSPDDRERFEQAYLTSPHRLKKVEANRTLLNLIAAELSPRMSPRQRLKSYLSRLLPVGHTSLRYSLAGLALVGMLCGLLGWLLVSRARLRSELDQAHAQWQQKENEYQRQQAASKQTPTPIPESPNIQPENARQSEREGQEPSKERSPERSASKEANERVRLGASTVIAFALPRGVVRTLGDEAGALKPLVIPRGTVLVRMKVDLERNDYGAYSVSLQKVGGGERWFQTVPKGRAESSATRIEVEVPSVFFQSGDYILKVTGSEPAREEEILAFHQITAINRKPRRAKADSAP
jgi:hypothetical protein